jgi:hypothetical protein
MSPSRSASGSTRIDRDPGIAPAARNVFWGSVTPILQRSELARPVRRQLRPATTATLRLNRILLSGRGAANSRAIEKGPSSLRPLSTTRARDPSAATAWHPTAIAAAGSHRVALPVFVASGGEALERRELKSAASKVSYSSNAARRLVGRSVAGR